MSEIWALALHGGAGTIRRDDMTPDREAAFRAGLAAAAEAGGAVLRAGGAALDAVEAAVRALEDDPQFNAGRGAVLTAEGGFELDAAVMRGRDRAAGAVMGVTTVANPVSLARRVMERTGHVALAGRGAEIFAREQGFAVVGPEHFETALRRDQLERARAAGKVMLDHADPAEFRMGTVGAVARDRAGHLAAATSTGGMTNKRPGRIGDSPVIGAGTYADDATCAVSATGHGEFFLRLVAAHEIAARIRHAGATLAAAAQAVVMEELPKLGGAGGLVALGPHGRPVAVFNTEGMYRATLCEGGAVETAIFA